MGGDYVVPEHVIEDLLVEVGLRSRVEAALKRIEEQQVCWWSMGRVKGRGDLHTRIGTLGCSFSSKMDGRSFRLQSCIWLHSLGGHCRERIWSSSH